MAALTQSIFTVWLPLFDFGCVSFSAFVVSVMVGWDSGKLLCFTQPQTLLPLGTYKWVGTMDGQSLLKISQQPDGWRRGPGLLSPHKVAQSTTVFQQDLGGIWVFLHVPRHPDVSYLPRTVRGKVEPSASGPQDAVNLGEPLLWSASQHQACCLLRKANTLLSVRWHLTAAVILDEWTLVLYFPIAKTGVSRVSAVLAKSRWGFPINKCTQNIYTGDGTWRLNT